MQMICPVWFQGFDSLFQFLFVIVTALVGLLGIRAYLFFRDERYRLHAYGFFLLAGAYLALALTNCAVWVSLMGLDHLLPQGASVATIVWVGTILYAILFLCALVGLLILYLQITAPEQRLLLTIFAFFTGLVATFDANRWTMGLYQLLAAVLIVFIIVQLYKRYVTHRTGKGLTVLVAFILLLIGTLIQGFVFILHNPILYVAGNVILLAGFGLILVNQFIMWRK